LVSASLLALLPGILFAVHCVEDRYPLSTLEEKGLQREMRELEQRKDHDAAAAERYKEVYRRLKELADDEGRRAGNR
jgi:hypothetical protein